MDKTAKPIYRRILLKLSGEALQGDHLFGIDAGKLARIAQEVASVTQLGVQVALVIGAGNLIVVPIYALPVLTVSQPIKWVCLLPSSMVLPCKMLLLLKIFP